MSTPPFLTLPTSACFASIVFTMTRVVGSTQSPFTLETQSFQWPGSQWSADVSMPPIKNRAIASDWISFALNLEGTFGQFLMGDPLAKNPRGIASGNPVVSGGSQSGNTLVTSGWSNNVNGILLKGDYIQIGSGQSAKLHMVTQDANSNGSGVANLQIQPALRGSPANAAPIITVSAKGLFRMSDNSFSWSESPGGIYRFSFRATEVVNA